MNYINLPTVLPGSPSKTRGQIQVRGPVGSVVVGLVAGPGVREQRPPKMTSLLGDPRTHVLRKKVLHGPPGRMGLPLSADPGSSLSPPLLRT